MSGEQGAELGEIGDIKIGCTGGGATHSDTAIPDIATKVRMVKDAGAFDYIDRTPPDDEFRALLKASERCDLPVRAGGWFYVRGRDEALFEQNIVKARLLGSIVHNVQLLTCHADGHVLSDREVADFYLWAHDFAMRHGVVPCFEVHVNMWSEHFGRVARVASLVEAHGVPFRMTLDHSHVVFKIDNPAEQDVQNMRADVESGALVLEPGRAGNVAQSWIENGWVHHAHARAAVPANPKNVRAHHPDGSYGRGIQYPFAKPAPGAYHADWDEQKLEPWKRTMRDLLRHRARDPAGMLGQISCEHIPNIDYGAGQGYSIFDDNVACARWLRAEWIAARAEVAEHETTGEKRR
jgi:hypothetical protein